MFGCSFFALCASTLVMCFFLCFVRLNFGDVFVLHVCGCDVCFCWLKRLMLYRDVGRPTWRGCCMRLAASVGRAPTLNAVDLEDATPGSSTHGSHIATGCFPAVAAAEPPRATRRIGSKPLGGQCGVCICCFNFWLCIYDAGPGLLQRLRARVGSSEHVVVGG